jgi:hypothetical protein
MRGFREAYRLRRGRGRKAALSIPRQTADDVPEPRALYLLICQALVTHQLGADDLGCCGHCRELWPCDTARRAYRLREGF